VSFAAITVYVVSQRVFVVVCVYFVMDSVRKLLDTPYAFATTSTPTLGSTQPPIQWLPGTFSLEVKRPGYKADHSEVKNARSYTSTPPYVMMARCLIRRMDNCIFYLYLCVLFVGYAFSVCNVRFQNELFISNYIFVCCFVREKITYCPPPQFRECMGVRTGNLS
jgi:hypothetical protein